jgi:hypothetical protein
MSKLKTDIRENITPIIFRDKVIIDDLKSSSSHPPSKKVVFVNTQTGELYSGDIDSSGSSSGTTEIATPVNQTMQALTTHYDGDLATNGIILHQPQGRVDVLVNGVSIDLGIDKDAYFSGNGGITARSRGSVQVGDKLYWNGSIANYELDERDVIDFDYLTIDSDNITPSVKITIIGGNWGILNEGVNYVTPSLYQNPPLESWTYNMDSNNHLKLYTAETSTDLIEVAELLVNGETETKTLYYDNNSITQDDKKIVDQLFTTYNVNGLTIIIERGEDWENFSIV